MKKILTEEDNPTHQKHKFVGMFRPPFKEILGEGHVDVYESRAGAIYLTRQDLYKAWLRGEFDYATYATHEEINDNDESHEYDESHGYNGWEDDLQNQIS